MKTKLFVSAAAAVAAGFALVAACGGGDDSGKGSGGAGGTGASDASVGGTGGTAATGGTGASGGSGGLVTDAPADASCKNGDPCGDAGVCAGGQCCESGPACGDTCCNAGDICSFGKCATPGAICSDTSDCPSGQYCELSLGDQPDGGTNDAGTCTGGAALLSGKCLPKPPTCAAGQQPGNPPTCIGVCQLTPPASSFAPVEKYAWGGQTVAPFATDIMMSPIVVELDDDDCDGKVTERDIPEIVFSTFSSGAYSTNGVLHAISIVNGQVVDKWSVSGVVHPTKQIAGGDVDGKPGNEVVACGTDGKVHAFAGDGTPLWTSAAMTCFMPSIADLDQDGTPEVIVEGAILDGATGATKHAYSAPLVGPPVVSDIDGDGKLDVVTASQGFDGSGTLFVDTGLANTGSFPDTGDWKGPWPAVADFDKDGKPEVVVMHNLSHSLSVWRYDATQANKFVVVRAPVDIDGTISPSACPSGNWGYSHGGGPPTIADFNGDGFPDVALAGGVGYVVFDGKKLLDSSVAGPSTILWIAQTTDCSSASTGSTVFDFNGDGVSEVIYSDEEKLRIYDGPTGNVLWETCNTTATLAENPVVADVDNDGHADIVAVSNAYAKTCPTDGSRQSGVRVFGDPDGKWVRTRRVWNEHAYHITNVNEDGTIPQQEATNYTTPGLDNFRQNKQPGNELSAPDAVVSISVRCYGAYGLVAIVQNVGEAALPAGIEVGFYSGDAPPGTLLGKLATTKPLYSLESEALFLPLAQAPQGNVFAVVDDTTTPHPLWAECRTDNNVSAAVAAKCGVVR